MVVLFMPVRLCLCASQATGFHSVLEHSTFQFLSVSAWFCIFNRPTFTFIRGKRSTSLFNFRPLVCNSEGSGGTNISRLLATATDEHGVCFNCPSSAGKNVSARKMAVTCEWPNFSFAELGPPSLFPIRPHCEHSVQ